MKKLVFLLTVIFLASLSDRDGYDIDAAGLMNGANLSGDLKMSVVKDG